MPVAWSTWKCLPNFSNSRQKEPSPWIFIRDALHKRRSKQIRIEEWRRMSRSNVCTYFSFPFGVSPPSHTTQLHSFLCAHQYDIKIITRSLTPASDSTTLIFMFVPCIFRLGTRKIFAHSHNCKKRAKSIFRLTIPTQIRLMMYFSHHFRTQTRRSVELWRERASACNRGGSHHASEWCLQLTSAHRRQRLNMKCIVIVASPKAPQRHTSIDSLVVYIVSLLSARVFESLFYVAGLSTFVLQRESLAPLRC